MLNDLFFKSIFNNALTGKLSDFAGLFIFPIFWTALFPAHKKSVYWLTAVLFIIWKSPHSQYFIETWNKFGIFSISRVVDYSDLSALLILPLSFYSEGKKASLKKLRLHPVVPIVLTAFSFIATSYNTNIAAKKDYAFDFPLHTLKEKINNLQTIKHWNNYTNSSYILDSASQHQVNNFTGDSIPASNSAMLTVEDTMQIYVLDDFCFDGYEAEIVLSGDNFRSNLKLIGFQHRCPHDGKFILPIKRQNDQKILTNSFETKIINQLLTQSTK